MALNVYKTAHEKLRDLVNDAERALDAAAELLEHLGTEEPPEGDSTESPAEAQSETAQSPASEAPAA